MSKKMDKAPRILDIYVRLCDGRVINKKEEAERKIIGAARNVLNWEEILQR